MEDNNAGKSDRRQYNHGTKGNKGGGRPKKAIKRKSRNFWLSDSEFEILKEVAQKLRKKNDMEGNEKK